ncbi:MAG: peroxiredoxin [Methylocystis sp.]|nr:peroxiredoxin [Methylocystis sp.]
MTIQIGDRLPQATFMVMTPEGPKGMTTKEAFGGAKVALFGLPGAFTPVCHGIHLPGFLAAVDRFKAKGVHKIAVTSVNDAFVMDAWAKATGADGKIIFLADGSANFAKAIGLSVDLSERGLGVRSQRYSMLVDDGVVKKLNVEEAPGKAVASGAERLLEQI